MLSDILTHIEKKSFVNHIIKSKQIHTFIYCMKITKSHLIKTMQLFKTSIQSIYYLLVSLVFISKSLGYLGK